MVSTMEMLYGKPSENWRPNTKLLYAAATSAGWSHAGVKNLIKTHFNRDSTKDLTWVEYNKVMEWIDRLPPDTLTVERDPNTLEMFP